MPPAGTLERWAHDYILTTDLTAKLSPPPPPSAWEPAPPPRRIDRPGRPAGLTLTARGLKTPGADALRAPLHRARLLHTFLHHELQAAELMAWAILAFPATPRPFRGGLAHIAMDEVRHIHMYQRHLTALGHTYGDFPVRDWFWQRVPTCRTPVQFVALLGAGLEGANLDHTARFAALFRAAGDEPGALLQERIGEEEIPHVRFALRWLKKWTGNNDFTTWLTHLPPPLSPLVMKGKPLDRPSRLKSGYPPTFLDALDRWTDRAPGT